MVSDLAIVFRWLIISSRVIFTSLSEMVSVRLFLSKEIRTRSSLLFSYRFGLESVRKRSLFVVSEALEISLRRKIFLLE